MAQPDPKPAIVLFRHDLRLADNRALAAAVATGKPLVAVFILDEESEGVRPLGGARRWWLHHSLTSLAASLRRHRVTLTLRRGRMDDVAVALVRETGADAVFWNRRYDPPAIAVDKAMKARLGEDGVATESFEGHLLHEPWQVRTGTGGYYRVYSPFWRALMEQPEPRDPIEEPSGLHAFDPPRSDDLDAWGLLPTKPDWAGGLRDEWTPGEQGAHERLADFLDGPIKGYAKGRDFPAGVTTSRLSPHLCHGEITPFQIWHATRSRGSDDAAKFRKELGWREFSWHLLFHNPGLDRENFNADFDRFSWRSDDDGLKAWRKARTGYPIVDAAMRELWHTGWMHNRMRMVAASFLIKHLMIDWRKGEAFFWDTLVDADPANNAASWQWVAGSGADAAPYFRIFNPILQGEKFDPDGIYTRNHVPELENIPDRWLQKPWEATKADLDKAGVELGRSYPTPIVEHGRARERALSAYKQIKGDADASSS